jgi:SAM-dependent methyltransferase
MNQHEAIPRVAPPPQRPALPETSSKAFRRHVRGFRWRVVQAFLRQAFHLRRIGKKPYEPIEIAGRRYDGLRQSEDRWEAIASVLSSYGARSLLDIGCAEGWFIRRAAKDLNCFAIGVEASDRLLLGEISRLHDGLERTAILKATLTAKDILELPRCDVVMCLSVVHHVIRWQGMEAALDFVRALRTRALKALIFEMGTSEESKLKWSHVLPEMPHGQEAFVRKLLELAGFTNVRLVTASSAFHGLGTRLMFSAEPPRQP